MAEKITIIPKYLEIKNCDDSAEKETIENTKPKLSKFEELALLKEIFYRFCINSTKILKKETKHFIETYKVIVEGEEKEHNSLIFELMSYSVSFFNDNIKNERVIANIRMSIEIIKKKEKNGRRILLQPLYKLNLLEIQIYYEVLKRYLNDIGDDGILTMEGNSYRSFNIYYI